jgi:hypothetical protein
MKKSQRLVSESARARARAKEREREKIGTPKFDSRMSFSFVFF